MRTCRTILESADHALFKMVRYVLLRPLRPELDAKTKKCLPAKTRFCHLDEQAKCRFVMTNITHRQSAVWLKTENNTNGLGFSERHLAVACKIPSLPKPQKPFQQLLYRHQAWCVL
jgi:hypothetical protein